MSPTVKHEYSNKFNGVLKCDINSVLIFVDSEICRPSPVMTKMMAVRAFFQLVLRICYIREITRNTLCLSVYFLRRVGVITQNCWVTNTYCRKLLLTVTEYKQFARRSVQMEAVAATARYTALEWHSIDPGFTRRREKHAQWTGFKAVRSPNTKLFELLYLFFTNNKWK